MAFAVLGKREQLGVTATEVTGAVVELATLFIGTPYVSETMKSRAGEFIEVLKTKLSHDMIVECEQNPHRLDDYAYHYLRSRLPAIRDNHSRTLDLRHRLAENAKARDAFATSHNFVGVSVCDAVRAFTEVQLDLYSRERVQIYAQARDLVA